MLKQAKVDPEKFKNHQLPLARIKKIMKSDEDVRMISAEAPVLFAKACELFIIELSYRAWIHTEEAKRRTLQKSDISACIATTDIFDFLIDLIPKDEYNKYVMKKNQNPAGIGGMNLPFQLPPNLNPQMLQNPNGLMGVPQFNPSMFMNFAKPPGMPTPSSMPQQPGQPLRPTPTGNIQQGGLPMQGLYQNPSGNP
eukprot:TRINITY_DN3134_c0_g1_i4.p1 TRINITY_DN3134_c0_g1~~TRINITY_DN3134_c0_g1_i4.p1  ORF type:complete len:196 (+),score=39.90 TRINITY_DN3134_c0_g1_i4:322-909(+)